MVAPLHPRLPLGAVPQLNLSRPMLHLAGQSALSGSTIDAAIRLREAARRQLTAMADYYRCRPADADDANDPESLLNAICDADILAGFEYGQITVMLELGNDAADCKQAKQSELYFYILRLHDIIDRHPCGDVCNRATRLADDSDLHQCDDRDDDDGDSLAWWKGGAA